MLWYFLQASKRAQPILCLTVVARKLCHGDRPERDAVSRQPEALRRGNPSAIGRALMAQYCYGEYVRIEISSGSVGPVSVWVRVEHSDDQHRLVYGTVDDQTSNRWGRAFS